MISDLGLKGNELLIYAIIFGFSQDGETKFKGSLSYLSEWTNSTKQGILKNLKSLMEKGLINKLECVDNGVKKVEYYATKFNGGIKQSLTGGIKQSLPNNLYIDNLVDNIEKEKINKKEKNKTLVSDDWLPDEKTRNKLVEQGLNWRDITEKFINACQAKGYKYINHNKAILSWDWSREKNKPVKMTNDEGIPY